MAVNDILQVTAVQKEKHGSKVGTLGYNKHHGAGWSGGRPRPSAQWSPLSGELDTLTGILVADRSS